jgi:hypothetical protein
MHSRQVIFAFGLLAAVATPSATLLAMEAATAANSRASNAALVRHLAAERADQLADLAAIQSQVDSIIKCTAKGRFFTPGKSGADADSCTDIEVTIIN